MRIEDVIDESILAVFKDRILSRHMVLKGGSALRMLEHDRTRLSIDADFSVRGSIRSSEPFFARMETTLSRAFAPRDYCVMDFRVTPRPKCRKPRMPRWWKGWLCQFKLLAREFTTQPLEAQRRRALVPEGSNSPVIEIEVSEHEYCGTERKRRIRGVVVHGYTRELLVLEKLRAICQQHPEYQFRSNKNRARDFYDIHRLCGGRMGTRFVQRCRKDLPAVFGAKAVPVDLLRALWDPEFLVVQQRGFAQVVDDVRGAVREFDVYVECLRYLVQRICPGMPRSETTPSSLQSSSPGATTWTQKHEQ
jgi:hypothetical protein